MYQLLQDYRDRKGSEQKNQNSRGKETKDPELTAAIEASELTAAIEASELTAAIEASSRECKDSTRECKDITYPKGKNSLEVQIGDLLSNGDAEDKELAAALLFSLENAQVKQPPSYVESERMTLLKYQCEADHETAFVIQKNAF